MNTKTILLVEDNQDDEWLTLLAFQESRISNPIVVARDGAEALDLLFGENGREQLHPSLILLDLKLPKVDGLEVLGRIRGDERTQRLPVVILTSSRQEQDLVASYNLGCNSYVRKPVQFPEFVDAVRQLGIYWLLLNQTPES